MRERCVLTYYEYSFYNGGMWVGILYCTTVTNVTFLKALTSIK